MPVNRAGDRGTRRGPASCADMKIVSLAAAATLLILAVGPAVPQSVEQPEISALRCSDLSGADPAYQAALIYYAAGYRDGVDYAMALNSSVGSQASSAISALATIPSTPASGPPPLPGPVASTLGATSAPDSASASSAAPAGRVLGGLTLRAQDVLEGCATAPDALVTDIIANRGGGTGFRGTPGGTGAAAGAQSAVPAQPAATTSASVMAPAGSAAASGAGGIASSVIDSVSRQVQ